jgi:hypothetical protein
MDILHPDVLQREAVLGFSQDLSPLARISHGVIDAYRCLPDAITS